MKRVHPEKVVLIAGGVSMLSAIILMVSSFVFDSSPLRTAAFVAFGIAAFITFLPLLLLLIMLPIERAKTKKHNKSLDTKT